jgi:hypothetical protein
VATGERWHTRTGPSFTLLRVSFLGDVKSSLGDAKSSLGDAKSSLGDAESSLGDAKSSLGDAKSSLGDANSSLGETLRARQSLYSQRKSSKNSAFLAGTLRYLAG